MKTRRGFTLIELLVVIGIVLILMSIIVMGFRHVHETSAHRETIGELQTCTDLLQEWKNIQGFSGIEGPTPQTIITGSGQSVLSDMMPVFVEDDPTKRSELLLSDLGVNNPGLNGNALVGTTDMGDKSAGLLTARYNAPAVLHTQDVMARLMKDPKNRALVSALPPKRIMEGQTAMNGTKTPSDIDKAVILDGYGDPIIFVPAGGLHVTLVDQSTGTYGARNEYIVRSSGTFPANQISSHPITAADQPFWASAGQDGDFAKGEDNVYSFQK